MFSFTLLAKERNSMIDREKLNLIINKLESDGWEAQTADYYRNLASFKKGFMVIEVIFEECVCHGGRITLCEKGHNNTYYRIEHECYDESLGIVDSETELLWEIENELLNVVKEFNHYTYKLCKINEYGQKNGRDDEKISYHKSLDDAFWHIACGLLKGIDPLTFEEGEFHYPNPQCHLRIKRIYKDSEFSWDKKKIWFHCENTMDNWKTKSEYDAYITYFDKN